MKVIITSRVILNIHGEQEYQVLPLPLPDMNRLIDLDSLRAYPSIQLFISRAKAIKPRFELDRDNAFSIAEICLRLDGLPLAIELAAARIKIFQPRAMLKKLENNIGMLRDSSRNRPERHKTLRQAIKWSYDLLEEVEQIFFRRLSIFVGGFTIEAAEIVCLEDIDTERDVFELIETLMDKSLIRNLTSEKEEPRFGMLEMLREFGLEQLQEQGEIIDLKTKFQTYFLEYTEELGQQLTSDKIEENLNKLEKDHSNILAVISEALHRREVETGLRMGAAIFRFWMIRGHLKTGTSLLKSFIHLAEDHRPNIVLAKALNAMANLMHNISEYPKAEKYSDQSIDIWRQIDNDKGLANALNSHRYMYR